MSVPSSPQSQSDPLASTGRILSISSPIAGDTVIEMRGIVKRFQQTVALAGVDLTVRRGEVQAIIGENGAGKSTLMHILAGLTKADQGEIAIQGKQTTIDNVESAYALGIAMVHQHFILFPSLSVAENLTLGREPRRHGFFDRAAAVKAVIMLGERYGLHVNPSVRVADLSVGDLQRLEILRALYRGADILILDEPTGVLTPQEAQGLFRVIRDLAHDGKTTLFISHKLEEVLEISETITVMRDGHVTGVVRTADTNAKELARLMVGRDVISQFSRSDSIAGKPILSLEHLSGPGVHGVSLRVDAGEIVGIAGVAGNGQSELAALIAGLLPVKDGTIRFGSQDVTRATVAQRRAAGLTNIPEDRYKQGLAAQGSIRDNLLMGFQDKAPIAKRGLFNRHAGSHWAEVLTTRFQIKTESVNNLVASLSGGNAQRVIIAREMAEAKPLILAAQPTRGIDIAASEFVRSTLIQRRNEGAGILLISADLGEILSVADRILVMYAGRIIGEVLAKDATETNIGLLMAGIRADSEPANQLEIQKG